MISLHCKFRNFGLCRTIECGLHMVVGWPLAIEDRKNKSKSDKLSSFLPSSSS